MLAQPWQHGLCGDLLSQGGGMDFHGHLEHLVLWA